MYIFVRITAVIFILIGLLLLVAGLVMGFMGASEYIRTPAPVEQLPSLLPTLPPGFTSLLMGGFMIFQGLVTAAVGQMMLVIVDIARNTRDSVQALRSLYHIEV